MTTLWKFLNWILEQKKDTKGTTDEIRSINSSVSTVLIIVLRFYVRYSPLRILGEEYRGTLYYFCNFILKPKMISISESLLKWCPVHNYKVESFVQIESFKTS